MRRTSLLLHTMLALVVVTTSWLPALVPVPTAAASPARGPAAAPLAATTPALVATQAVTQEPLLGGGVAYTIALRNTADTPVDDRGYNLTVVDTLPVGVAYLSADPAPQLVEPLADGSTRITWQNIADLEAGEALDIAVNAQLASTLTMASTFANAVTAKLNTMPDNSGTWVSATSSLTARPQAIDIEVAAKQSTGVHQATGAGEYDAAAPGRGVGADWPYQYQLTVSGNRMASVAQAQAVALLPPGVAYLGSPVVQHAPQGASATPTINLESDGSLRLTWALGVMSTSTYTTPVVIRFDAAVPYRFRTAADMAAASGPFAGPMSGAIIPEDAALALTYEASASYSGATTTDGTQSTPDDDAPAQITADLLTMVKHAAPGTVGIGDTVSFSLDYAVSEYYALTTVVLTDTLPDGMTYVPGSASLAPSQVQENTPSAGRTTITWSLPDASTTAGNSGQITFQATVDPSYEGQPYAGAPVVSGDMLTNQSSIGGHWADVQDSARESSATPTLSNATVATAMPSFTKEVWDAATSTWGSSMKAFTGDTARFRLRYASAAHVDAREIVIRDFLPHGMAYVAGSAQQAVAGTFTSGPTCTSAPSAPTVGSMGGLAYLEWRLCNAAQGSTWEATIQARIGDIPDVQPDWIVANFGKLTGQSSFDLVYSQRALAMVDYAAPRLVLTKSASPSTNLVGGSVVNYTISVKNQGRAAAYGLALTDVVPANLTVAGSGGTGSPSASSYTATSGSPAAAKGGTLAWAAVATLAPGATQTYRYSATVPPGLPSGSQMTNLASVAYNSRADSTGHQWAATSAVADDNTDDETVYLKGMRITKSATPTTATIGDVVQWTLTGTLPPGQIGYWPVVEENDLPAGFDYVPGSTVVSNTTLDTTHHAANPKDDGDRDLRWFLQTIDNTAGTSSYVFTITFSTLVTGVKGTQPSTTYYPNNCCLSTASNSSYVGWYDAASGYSGQGYALDTFDTTKIDRRSPVGAFSVQIRQPSISLATRADHSVLGAGETVTLVLEATNLGNSEAYDLALADALPAGLTFLATESATVRYPAGFPGYTPTITDTNTVGATALSYSLDALHVGATLAVTVKAKVDAGISAGLTLTNRARITSYTSRPGTRPDSNGDGLADERSYQGGEVTLAMTTPAASIGKQAQVSGEFTYGADVTYQLTVPATPVNAWVYGATVRDVVDARLTPKTYSGGSAAGNTVQFTLGDIAPNQQRTLSIVAHLGAASAARDGDLISNQASLTYTNGGTVQSNPVSSLVTAPALVVGKSASKATVVEGDTVQYTVTVRNVGSGPAQSLTIADTLPEGAAFVAGSAHGPAGQSLADSASWPLAALAGGATYTVTYQASFPAVADAQAFASTASATGQSTLGVAIPANSAAHVPADTDPLDIATITVYGPLDWQEESVTVAYEDLKKFSWSDWDYNDLLVRITTRRALLPDGGLAAIEIDYAALARGAGFLNHSFMHHLPFMGGGWYAVQERNPAGGVVRSASASFAGDEPTVQIYRSTRAALPQPPGMEQTNTSPSQQGYIQGYTASATVVLNDSSLNTEDVLTPLPWDPFLRVTETGQEVHLVQPGYLDNTQAVTNRYDSTSPLIGYDLPLAQVFPGTWRWPSELVGIWRGYPMFTTFIKRGGSVYRNWSDPSLAAPAWLWSGTITGAAPAARADEQAPTSGYFASPTVADITGDGVPEILIGNQIANRMEVYDAARQPLPGWPQPVGGSIRAAATVADITGDGTPEVLVGAADGKLYAWDAAGHALAGWPVQLGVDSTIYRVLAAPAVGDLDGDGTPEIVVPLAEGRIYALTPSGAAKPGWPASIGLVHDEYQSQVINSSPKIVDLDGDGHPEVVVGSTDGRLYVFNGDGSQRWSYASGDMVLGAPAVGELSAATPGKEIVFASGDRYVYLLDAQGSRIWRRATGWTVRSTPLLADMDGDGTPEVLVGGDDNKLWAWHADGTRVAGWPQATQGDLFSSPAFGDIDGDGAPEVVVGSDDGSIYAWHADGTTVANWPHTTSQAVKGTPALANLDGDPALEVVVPDMGGVLNAWGTPSQPAVKTYQIMLPLVSR